MIKEIEMYEVICDKCGKTIQVRGDDIDDFSEKFGWTMSSIGDDEPQTFCEVCSNQLKAIIGDWIKMVPGSAVLISKDHMDKELTDQYEKGFIEGGHTLHKKLNEFGILIAFGERSGKEFIEVNVPACGSNITYPDGCANTRRFTIYK